MTVGETSVGSFAHCGVRGRVALTRDGGWERDAPLSLRWKGELSFTTVNGSTVVNGSTSMLLVILVGGRHAWNTDGVAGVAVKSADITRVGGIRRRQNGVRRNWGRGCERD